MAILRLKIHRVHFGVFPNTRGCVFNLSTQAQQWLWSVLSCNRYLALAELPWLLGAVEHSDSLHAIVIVAVA